jgi:hypothetical protein
LKCREQEEDDACCSAKLRCVVTQEHEACQGYFNDQRSDHDRRRKAVEDLAASRGWPRLIPEILKAQRVIPPEDLEAQTRKEQLFGVYAFGLRRIVRIELQCRQTTGGFP